MAEEEFAYQASEALEAAVRAAEARVRAWQDKVLLPWQDEHPDVAPLWVRESHGTPMDKRCVGFTDSHPDREPPEGLSRNKQRQELRPARGAAGDPWRELLDRFNTRPRVSDAFAAHGVELAILDIEASRLRWPALVMSTYPGETGLWLRYKGIRPRETEHLTSIPMSGFYAALEGIEGREKAREGERVAVAAGGPVES